MKIQWLAVAVSLLAGPAAAASSEVQYAPAPVWAVAPAPIERIKRRYRWQLIVKAPAVSDLHRTIAATRTALEAQAERAGVRLSIDLDPINMM